MSAREHDLPGGFRAVDLHPEILKRNSLVLVNLRPYFKALLLPDVLDVFSRLFEFFGMKKVSFTDRPGESRNVHAEICFEDSVFCGAG